MIPLFFGFLDKYHKMCYNELVEKSNHRRFLR